MARRLETKTLKVNDFFNEFEKDDIKQKVSIVSLFNHFNIDLKQKGKSFIGNCPWHEDKTPSLSVDQEKGLYNCFGCGESGDIFSLVEKMKGVEFKEALEYLKEFSNSADNRKPEKVLVQNIEPEQTKPEQTKPEQTKSEAVPKLDAVKSPFQETCLDISTGSIQGSARQPENLNEFTCAERSRSTEKERLEFLQKISEFFHKKLSVNKTALSYLEKRGIDDLKLLREYSIGFGDSSIVELLSKKDKDLFHSLGGLNEKGNFVFTNRIIFPLFDESGQAVGIYGRASTPLGNQNSSGLKHLYLEGEHKGLFNGKAAKVYDSIILTESIIDSISLIQCGISNTIPCYGTNGFTKVHLEALKNSRVKEVIICFDNDSSGRASADKLKERLVEEDFAVKVISTDLKDVNDELVENGKESLKALIDERIKQADVSVKSLPEQSTDNKYFETSKDGFHFIFKKEDLTYRVSGVKELFVNNLRVNIKVTASAPLGNPNDTLTSLGDRDSYYDNIDLYSARSRKNFASSLSAEFETESKVVEKDLLKILEYLEDRRDKRLTSPEENTEVELTEEEKEAGMKLLKDKNFFDILTKDMEKLGYVGEDLNKKLLYIAASSRKLDDPVSVLIISQSASGKSYLVDTVKELIPPEDVISVTSLSDQALNYISDLEHKFLVLSEAVHNDVVEHQLREMLSAKELSRMVTVKDNTGTMTTRIVKTKAIVSTVMSSTNHNVNPENASRSFVIDTDESREQTKRIHEKQRSKYTLERYKEKAEEIPAIIKRHHAAQRLLKKRIIVNPFGKYLDFPDMLMRTRRDHDRFMDLIACICFIRQYQKEVLLKEESEYIECDLTDYKIAFEVMVGSVLSSTLFDIPKAAIEVYESIREYTKAVSKKKKDISEEDISFTQRDIRDFSGLNQMQVKRNIRLLVDFEYLYVVSGGRARSKGIYRLVKNEPIEAVSLSRIPSPEDIQKKYEKLGQLVQTGADPDL